MKKRPAMQGAGLGYASRMATTVRKLGLTVLAIVAAAAAVVLAYWQFGEYQKRSQQKAIAELVGQGTEQLRGALGATPTKEQIAAIDKVLEQLRKTPASRQIAMAGAAEAYLVSVRAIVLRKAEVARLAPQAAARRNAL